MLSLRSLKLCQHGRALLGAIVYDERHEWAKVQWGTDARVDWVRAVETMACLQEAVLKATKESLPFTVWEGLLPEGDAVEADAWLRELARGLEGKGTVALARETGVPVAILACPVTFPPDEINGTMLSGMGTPRRGRSG